MILVTAGEAADLQWCQESAFSWFELKILGFLGGEPKDLTETTILGRKLKRISRRVALGLAADRSVLGRAKKKMRISHSRSARDFSSIPNNESPNRTLQQKPIIIT